MPPKAKAGAKKKAGGYQMPEKFTEGFTINDVYKKPWTLGKPIGQGGFGLIYLANRGEVQVKKTEDAEYVVKIEPKENGPLFCETHFYLNCAKEDDIKNYLKSKNLKHLAIPRYVSQGSCTYNEKEYRFLVMDRYKADVQSIIDRSANKRHDEIGVLCLMRQVIRSLEYIHQRGYAHGDIKGANLMLNNDRESYLVDYGLAHRFMRDNIHQKYEIKPERRHNGTIEYLSRDAHDGAQINRRSDLEILAFCVIHWLSGTLPWIDLIKSPEQVQNSKIKSMKNVKEFINATLGTVNTISESVKTLIEYYLNEINKLQFDSEPPYLKITNKISDTLKLLGHSSETIDNFNSFNQTKANSKTTTKTASIATSSSVLNLIDESEIVSDDISNGRKQARKPRVSKKKEIIVNDTEEESDVEIQESKKSKIIYPGLAATIPKCLIQSEKCDPKSPKINGRQSNNSNKTPLKRADSLISEENDTEEIKPSADTHKSVGEETPKYSFRATPKRQQNDEATPQKGTDEKNYINQDLLNKFNAQNGISSKPPRSPLAVTSANLENKNGPVLIKRKKNVPKSTVSTQTENSYLSQILSNNK